MSEIIKQGELLRIYSSPFSKDRAKKAFFKLYSDCLMEFRNSGIGGSPRKKKLFTIGKIQSVAKYVPDDYNAGFGWKVQIRGYKADIVLIADTDEERWSWMKELKHAQEGVTAGQGRSLFAFAHQNCIHNYHSFILINSLLYSLLLIGS